MKQNFHVWVNYAFNYATLQNVCISCPFLWYKCCLKWECSVCSEFNWLISIALGQGVSHTLELLLRTWKAHLRYFTSPGRFLDWGGLNSPLIYNAINSAVHLSFELAKGISTWIPLSRSDSVWITERVSASVTDPLDIQHNAALSSYTSYTQQIICDVWKTLPYKNALW